MASEGASFSRTFLAWLPWLLAAGTLVFLPSWLVRHFTASDWPDTMAELHRQSQQSGRWMQPWVGLQTAEFANAWIACASLEDAIALDRLIDDGLLHSGNLILAESGLLWRP